MGRAMKAVPPVLLCALIIAVPSVWADWAQNGVAICTATGDQWPTQITSDGAGGAIVTMHDERVSWQGDIYAQRVNASGAVQWAANGVALCTWTGVQYDPQTCSDGAGGAIVTWEDAHTGDFGIYAQRVNASGVVQWTANGVAVCTPIAGEGSVGICSDGAGGAIVTWTEDRRGNYTDDIYAQRLDPSGAVLWAADGVPLCAAASQQRFPEIVSDGAGGAIVTWQDSRNNGEDDIYAQRVNASGLVQWTANGVAVCTYIGHQYDQQICSDGARGAIITFSIFPRTSWDVYAQRVDSSGAVRWAANGVALCTATGSRGSPTIVSDDAGGAIVAWCEGSSANHTTDIHAQRIDPSGALLWGADGVVLCAAAENQYYHKIISDSAGGAIVTWSDYRKGNGDVEIYAQRVNASGAVQWVADGMVLCDWRPWGPRIAPDGVGGAFVTWGDSRSGDEDVYCQRVDGAGHVAPEIATLLQNYSVALEGTSVRVDWVLSEIDQGVRFFVLRASAPDWNYIELEDAPIAQGGLSFTVTDGGCLPGSTYKYRVEYGAEGAVHKALFETDTITIPATLMTLYQNYPNPFNPSTAIKYSLSEQSWVQLRVYDHSGRRIASLVDGEQQQGLYTAHWDGRDEGGHSVASGVYCCRLTAGKQTISKKMVLLR